MNRIFASPRNQIIGLVLGALIVIAGTTTFLQFNSHPLKASGSPIEVDLFFQSVTSSGTVPSQGYISMDGNDCVNSAITHQTPVTNGFVSCVLASASPITRISFYDTVTQTAYAIALVDVQTDVGSGLTNALNLLPNQSIRVQATVDERANPGPTVLTDLNASPPATITSLSDATIQKISN